MPKILIGNVVGPAGADGIGIKNITFKEEQADGNVYTITLTDDSTYDVKAPKGPQGPTGAKGEDGQAGAAGAQGVSIESIVFTRTNEDGGNVYTITLTNQNTYEFTAPRGQQGIPGIQGPAGSTDYNNLENKPDVYTKTETNNLLNDKLGKKEKAESAKTADSATTCTGNSATATTLQTARTINGVSFNGSANITIADSTKLPTSGGTISGNLTVTGAIVSNGEVTAYSDKRLKTNIVKIDNALEKVNQVNGYTFTMLGTGQRQAGVIAQEIEKILPEVVVQNKNGYLTVAYGHIVSLLIEAIKELNDKVKKLDGGR